MDLEGVRRGSGGGLEGVYRGSGSSTEGREDIPGVGANHRREERIYLEWEPLTGGKRGYTHPCQLKDHQHRGEGRIYLVWGPITGGKRGYTNPRRPKDHQHRCVQKVVPKMSGKFRDKRARKVRGTGARRSAVFLKAACSITREEGVYQHFD